MSNNQFTIQLSNFYRSKYRNEFDEEGAWELRADGDFLHYNEIIDQTFNKPFELMHLKANVSDDFKKEFAKRFWDREIGFETFTTFFRHLESDINTKYFNLFKLADFLRTMSLNDMQLDHENHIDTDDDGNAQALNIVNTTPQNRREIVFTDKYGVIEYANQLVEDHNKHENDNRVFAYGWSAENRFNDFNQMALVSDVYEIILQSMDDLFLGVWL